MVGFYDDRKGQRVRVYLHHIVAGVFLGPRPKGLQVNHKDGDKHNNAVDNLEYVTPGENNLHAYRIGLKKHQPGRGEANFTSKLKEVEVRCMRVMRYLGATYAFIAQCFSINKKTAIGICKGHGWSHID